MYEVGKLPMVVQLEGALSFVVEGPGADGIAKERYNEGEDM